MVQDIYVRLIKTMAKLINRDPDDPRDNDWLPLQDMKRLCEPVGNLSGRLGMSRKTVFRLSRSDRQRTTWLIGRGEVEAEPRRFYRFANAGMRA
jgi:hypothetical protein